MPKMKVLAAIHNQMEKVEGEDKPVLRTYVRGDEVEVSQEDIDRIGPSGLGPVDSDVEPEPHVHADPGAPVVEAPVPSGTEEAPGDAPDSPVDDEADAADEGAEGYESWTNAELSTELANRGLATSGNKAEMVARLEEDDEDKQGA